MPRIPRRVWPAACLAGCALAFLACCCGGRLDPTAAQASRSADADQETASKESAISFMPNHSASGRSDQVSGIGSAVAASLPYLEREGRAWMDGETFVQEGSACVSCHQVPFALWGQGSARRAGLAAAAGTWTALGTDAMVHTLSDDNGRAGIFAPLLLADVSGTIDAGDRREVLRQLVDSQEPDGRWAAQGQFPSQRRPADETDGVITLWTLLAIHDDADREAEVAASRDRALAWLEDQLTQPAERSTEWLAARLLLGRRMAGHRRTTGLLGDLLARQNADGGWGFRAGDPSDAMTTGQVLYALAQASLSEDALRRGADYLLGRQNDDGSWTVPSRLFSQHPSDRNDYIYDVWGTGWATVGLAAVERRTVQRGVG